jgi:protein SOK2
MGPPGTAPRVSDPEHHESKGPNGLVHHEQGQQVGHVGGEEEAEHEHDAEYTHDNNTGYDAARGPYSYAPSAPIGNLTSDHAHLAQDLNGSPGHQNGSGRATSRTSAASQPYYSQQQGYSTPPRAQPPSSNLYNVMSSERGTANGSGEYSQPGLENSMPNGYAHPVNGAISNGKRGRDEEDERPDSRGGDIDQKRRKTIRENSVPGVGYDANINRARNINPVISRRR